MIRRKQTQHDLIRLLVLVAIPMLSLIAMPRLVPGDGPLVWAANALIWLPLVAVFLWFYAYPILVTWSLMTQRRWADRDLDERIAANFELPGVQENTRPSAE